MDCFNPRTHEGCDNIVGIHRNTMDVSIHAPMKGATKVCHGYASFLYVSIHAPMKGATSWSGKFFAGYVVSIHAPMKGATHQVDGIVSNAMFQSTHP